MPPGVWPWFGPLQSLAVQATMYGGFELRSGDSDKAKRWGGRFQQGAAAAGFVRELQADLAAVGCLDVTPDGNFGHSTSTAVKRFQYCLRNATHRTSVKMSLLEEVRNDHGIFISGIADHATARHLKAWVSGSCAVTGTLRVVALSKFGKFRKGSLQKIDHVSVTADDMVVHMGFAASLDAINKAADKAGLLFHVNQTMRLAGKPVSGAVVKPASKSQHLIGNAVDFNVEHNGKKILSKDMNWSGLEQDVKNFLTEVKGAGMRWGGDWADRDPIHFDSYIDPGGDEFEILYFLNQRTIQKGQPILRVK